VSDATLAASRFQEARSTIARQKAALTPKTAAIFQSATTTSAYTTRHGLRAADLVDLRWSQVDLDNAHPHLRRVKKGVPRVHPLRDDEMRASPKAQAREQQHRICLSRSVGRPLRTVCWMFLCPSLAKPAVATRRCRQCASRIFGGIDYAEADGEIQRSGLGEQHHGRVAVAWRFFRANSIIASTSL